MTGAQRGPDVGIKVVLFVAIASVTLSACGRTQTADDRPSAAPVTTMTPEPTPCRAPELEPGYLPDGVRSVDRRPLVARPERTRTWEGDGVLVQLLEDFSADHGDDPNIRPTTVRGERPANLSAMQTAEGETTLIDWTEETPCGQLQYAVATTGLGEEETLRVARSLE